MRTLTSCGIRTALLASSVLLLTSIVDGMGRGHDTTTDQPCDDGDDLPGISGADEVRLDWTHPVPIADSTGRPVVLDVSAGRSDVVPPRWSGP